MILRPRFIENPELITLEIRDNTIILISPPELKEKFHIFALEYNFIRNPDNAFLWEKSAPPQFINDYAAEIGFMLLRHGCVIQVDNEILVEKINTEDFTPEKIRWIDYLDTGRFKNWFHVQWKKEDLYRELKRTLPGCKPYNYNLAVPVYFYREIIDFAKDWHFEFTDKAKDFLEIAPKNIIVLFENHLKIPKKIKIPDELKDNSL